MNTLTESDMALITGGQQMNALQVWGEQAASDGLNYAGTASGSNPALMGGGVLIAAAGGWAWAIGSFWSGLTGIFGY